MVDLIVVAVLAVVLGLAIRTIRREKKRGGCVGCPHSKTCAAAGNDGCGNPGKSEP